MKQLYKTICTVTILMMMNSATAQDANDNDNHETLWFSTATSALLSRSSTELAINHISRGLRLAQHALQQDLTQSDQMIANHNLCVGYLSSGEAETAKPYCTLATDLAQQSFTISKIRGAYYLSEDTKKIDALTENSVLQVVLDNIGHHNSHIHLSLFQ
ncbi:MAG: hypothetical protein ACN4GR_04625 [Arenicellales bacterium]